MTTPAVTVRWAQQHDLREVATLSARIFDPDSAAADSWITWIVNDVASGSHPQAAPEDYAVAVDEGTGRIVAAAVLFEQPWRFGRTTIMTGRPEVVVTASTHRGGGVMRRLLELLHERSVERGHVAQSITGVPGVYRHLGYEYTHPLGDGYIAQVDGSIARGLESGLVVADARTDEAGPIASLLDAARPPLAVTTPETPGYLAFGSGIQSPLSRRGVHTLSIRDGSGGLVAAVQLARGADPYFARVVAAGIAAVGDPVAVLRAVVAHEFAEKDGEILLALGEAHELYDVASALGWSLRRHIPDRWYFRVPDTADFLSALRPELDARLAASIFRRHSGELTLDLRHDPVTIELVDGVIERIVSGGGAGERLAVRPESVPALLAGATSVRALVESGPETHGSALALALGDALLPRLRSRTLALD